jgi:mRNA-degrading endonuclease toxin of MazEF toxin-antitoxin module
LRIQLPEVAGLQQSYAVVPGIRQVSKARITEHLGDVPAEFLKLLESACIAYLSD